MQYWKEVRQLTNLGLLTALIFVFILFSLFVTNVLFYTFPCHPKIVQISLSEDWLWWLLQTCWYVIYVNYQSFWNEFFHWNHICTAPSVGWCWFCKMAEHFLSHTSWVPHPSGITLVRWSRRHTHTPIWCCNCSVYCTNYLLLYSLVTCEIQWLVLREARIILRINIYGQVISYWSLCPFCVLQVHACSSGEWLSIEVV